MQTAKIEDVKQGDYLKLRDNETSKVYKRAEYSREDKAYLVQDVNDMNAYRLIKKGRIVFIGFTY